MKNFIELTKMLGELVGVEKGSISVKEVINGETRIHLKNSNKSFDVKESYNQIFNDDVPPFEFYVK